MKNEKHAPNKDSKSEKKKYEKPQIMHTSVIETLAGSCIQLGGCVPSVT